MNHIAIHLGMMYFYRDSPVPFQEDWFRFRSHEEFEANCDLKVDLYDYLGHMKLVNEQPLTDCPILNGVDIAKKRHLRVHVQTRGGPLMKLYIWDKAAADFCLKYKSYGRTPSAILVTTLNPKRIGGTLARLLCHLHGFLWTLMSNQQEIILAVHDLNK
ncbi:BnaC01g28080D [Brassica napus]|uniref:BnaC01g28080D protein n=1 Tax=Brassica napus TaxID=3708 RepID=A0A078HMV3_BRANA|nr:BnaC01g28080D [Brassica napus]